METSKGKRQQLLSGTLLSRSCSEVFLKHQGPGQAQDFTVRCHRSNPLMDLIRFWLIHPRGFRTSARGLLCSHGTGAAGRLSISVGARGRVACGCYTWRGHVCRFRRLSRSVKGSQNSPQLVAEGLVLSSDSSDVQLESRKFPREPSRGLPRIGETSLWYNRYKPQDSEPSSPSLS